MPATISSTFFIGSEGTLGLITELVVSLHPKPRRTETALVGCPDPESLPPLLQMARSRFGSRLLSFEAMWPSYVEITVAQPGMGPRPLAGNHGAYGVIESAAGTRVNRTHPTWRRSWRRPSEAEHVEDAVIAQSEGQRAAIWRVRKTATSSRHGTMLP